MSTHRVRQPSRFSARGRRFVIIASRFNPAVTHSLVRAAAAVLRRSGAASGDIRLFWVSGAFELPQAAARVARSAPKPDAVIALGALVRGQTIQYEVIAHAVAEGLMQVSVLNGIPVSFGVIVAETEAQARQRAGLPASRRSRRGQARQAGGRLGNRGAEAAEAALSVLDSVAR